MQKVIGQTLGLKKKRETGPLVRSRGDWGRVSLLCESVQSEEDTLTLALKPLWWASRRDGTIQI